MIRVVQYDQDRAVWPRAGLKHGLDGWRPRRHFAPIVVISYQRTNRDRLDTKPRPAPGQEVGPLFFSGHASQDEAAGRAPRGNSAGQRPTSDEAVSWEGQQPLRTGGADPSSSSSLPPLLSLQ